MVFVVEMSVKVVKSKFVIVVKVKSVDISLSVVVVEVVVVVDKVFVVLIVEIKVEVNVSKKVSVEKATVVETIKLKKVEVEVAFVIVTVVVVKVGTSVAKVEVLIVNCVVVKVMAAGHTQKQCILKSQEAMVVENENGVVEPIVNIGQKENSKSDTEEVPSIQPFPPENIGSCRQIARMEAKAERSLAAVGVRNEAERGRIGAGRD